MSGTTTPRKALPTMAEIRQLPCYHRATIGPEHLDTMGHMNIRWYMAFYDETAWAFAKTMDMDEAYFRATQSGLFALQHYIRYMAEVLSGDEVAVYGRLIGLSASRFLFMGFLVNETQDRVASTAEALVAFADMSVRRVAPFPPDVAARMNDLLARHNALDWEAPLSGIMAA